MSCCITLRRAYIFNAWMSRVVTKGEEAFYSEAS